MAAALASLVFSVNLTLLACSSARTQPLYPETLSSNPVGLKTAEHKHYLVCEFCSCLNRKSNPVELV